MSDDLAARILAGLTAANGAAPTDVELVTDLHHWVEPLDWPSFLSGDDDAGSEWLAEPVIPAGAQVAIWARAKVGKSLLLLDIAASLACGRPLLGGNTAEPAHVVYVDMENPAGDVRSRVLDLGYTASSDLSRLHYFHIPSLPPLDTDLGGAVLAAQVDRFGAVLVVVDTTASAVGGGENDSDTYRGFYRYTGRRLRATGTALVRLDHGGKDRTKGQRGSSAKDDDVDVVFEMTHEGEHLVLRRTRSRFPWVPAAVRFRREEEPELRHILAPAALPEGTLEAAAALDVLAVPLETSVRVAMAALRESGNGRRRDAVAGRAQAQKAAALTRGTRVGSDLPEQSGNAGGEHRGTLRRGERGEQSGSIGPAFPHAVPGGHGQGQNHHRRRSET